jgi:hypothetical protein
MTNEYLNPYGVTLKTVGQYRRRSGTKYPLLQRTNS